MFDTDLEENNQIAANTRSTAYKIMNNKNKLLNKNRGDVNKNR